MGPTTPNLLTSVSANPATGTGRWSQGIAYRPPRYNTGGSVDPFGLVGEGTKTTGEGPDLVEWDPYMLWTEDNCSTLTGNAEDLRSYAIADMDTQTSHKLEAILWSNQVDGSDFGASHPNISLSDPSVPNDNSATYPGPGVIWVPNDWVNTNITSAFKTMISALGQALGGARGMIHVEKRILPFISYAGLAVQNGQRLLTTLGDHVVVPGTGYDGSSPVGGPSSEFHTWIYGTSPVEVLTAPVDVYPDDLAGAVNRETNLVEYRAERLALAHWDRQAHIGIPVCLEDPFGDCSDSGS